MAFTARILSWRFRHLNIVGCLRKRRPTEGESRAPQDHPPSYAPAYPRTSAEPKDKFFSHCLQVSAGDHMQIMGDPIDAVEVKVLTSQTHMFKLGRV